MRAWWIPFAAFLSSCAYDAPVQPSVITPVARVTLAASPSVLRLDLSDYLCVGGVGMVAAQAQGYASDGLLRGVPNVTVRWSSSTLMVVPSALWTDATGRATAEVAAFSLDLAELMAEAGGLRAVMLIQPKTAEFCLAQRGY